MKNIAILGSTGSIGTQTLEIVRENPDLAVKGLAAGTNVALMEKQIREFVPETAVMWTEEAAQELRARVKDLPVRILCGYLTMPTSVTNTSLLLWEGMDALLPEAEKTVRNVLRGIRSMKEGIFRENPGRNEIHTASHGIMS